MSSWPLDQSKKVKIPLKSFPHPSVQIVSPHAQIKVMQLDLDDFASVHGFAQQVRKKLDTLDLFFLMALQANDASQLSLQGTARRAAPSASRINS